MALFSFLQGVPQQSQYANGYNMNIDLSRKPSMFQNGYNMQLQSAPGPEPVNGYMPYVATPAPQPESAQQLAPSLLAAPSQSQTAAPPMKTRMGTDESQAAMNEAKAMAAQGSPMLSQVQQMGGRYRRQFKGLLG